MTFESDTAPAVEPFETGPAQLSGCGKPAVIGCLVVLLVVAAGLLLLMWKAQDLLEFAIEEYREAVAQSLPRDLSAEERRRLDDAFDAAVAAIASGDLDPAGLRKLQRSLSSPPRPGETLSRETILELTLALEGIAGDKGPGAERDGATSTGERVPLVAVASW